MRDWSPGPAGHEEDSSRRRRRCRGSRRFGAGTWFRNPSVSVGSAEVEVPWVRRPTRFFARTRAQSREDFLQGERWGCGASEQGCGGREEDEHGSHAGMSSEKTVR